ncbi:ABC transporter ATP-binding protein [Chryseobacterium oryzae]|uniref:Polysaccharide ABC transporter ATP-binding protein n=1 Tax=Chryseobacterium oryzae TaxID=2929799 RepID=A0ABY4BFQ0_9FLAO|nr:polysaccharide ABC transporter ATP-binding protein [Chryseobacterium oryzae]UOE37998.1 polysaccharide ABC transporter ATP-binding protein [Chryseobacterium oryzae]
MLALKAENISKQYRLGQVGTGTLTHDLNRFWHKVRGKEDPYLKIGEANDRSSKGSSDYVWSLRDINFEIEQGDAVGIIGRNGAGKSTLLKILSKVTKPTTGKVYTNGRIASLLEVGTGFHPEMTGRENIFLNGAILGMTRKEITRKFDEIVEFSGVERYIDTPVKRYSSGMYVRLAFAVAAHLESEILIVDEVLAVGDAEFQKKCLGKMGDVTKSEGRTILFVSHNMAAISALCNKGIYIKNGLIASQGNISQITSDYLLSDDGFITFINDFSKYKIDNSIFKPLEFSLLDENRNVIENYARNDSNIFVNFKFEINQIHDDFNFGIAVYDLHDQILFWSFNTDVEQEKRVSLKTGENKIELQIPKHLLNEGEYVIHLMASIHYKYWIIEPNVNSPKINLKIQGGLSNSEKWLERRNGILAPIIEYHNVKD